MAKARDLADQLVAGRLDALMQEWRDAGESYDQIARRLGEIGVQVTGETVRRWCSTVGMEAAS